MTMDLRMYNIETGYSINIKRTDGRVHSAVVSGINWEQRTVTVEWFERGETKGKEVEIDAIIALNPDLTNQKTIESPAQMNNHTLISSRARHSIKPSIPVKAGFNRQSSRQTGRPTNIMPPGSTVNGHGDSVAGLTGRREAENAPTPTTATAASFNVTLSALAKQKQQQQQQQQQQQLAASNAEQQKQATIGQDFATTMPRNTRPESRNRIVCLSSTTLAGNVERTADHVDGGLLTMVDQQQSSPRNNPDPLVSLIQSLAEISPIRSSHTVTNNNNNNNNNNNGCLIFELQLINSEI